MVSPSLLVNEIHTVDIVTMLFPQVHSRVGVSW